MEISENPTGVGESAAISALGTKIEKVVDKVPAWEASSYEGYSIGGDQTRKELEVKGVSLKIDGKTLIIARQPSETWIAGFPGLEVWPKGTMAVVQDASGLRPATDQDLSAAETVLKNLSNRGQNRLL